MTEPHIVLPHTGPQVPHTAAQAWLDDQAPHLDANLAVLTVTDPDRYHAT